MLNRICNKIKEKTAETLAEAVISIAVFALLVLAVTTLLGAASRMTTRAENDANLFRDARNAAASGAYGDAASSGTVTVIFDGANYQLDVSVYDDNGVAAWRP